MFFAVCSAIDMGYFEVRGRIIVSDISDKVVDFFLEVKHNYSELNTFIRKLIDSFNDHTDKRAMYNTFKDKYNARSFDMSRKERSGILFFLNHTCYSAMIRENKKGDFNCSFNPNKKKLVYKNLAGNLKTVSKMLSKVELKQTSFDNILKHATKGDFVYMDPPYFGSDHMYTKHVWDHDYFRQYCMTLAKKTAIMVSNSSLVDYDFLKKIELETDNATFSHKVKGKTNMYKRKKRKDNIFINY